MPAGSVRQIEPDLLCLVAPNPSPLTAEGTNTYLLGRRDIAVIDPGPDDPRHLAAILAALPSGARLHSIIVTHAHLDHSALAARLAARTGAPVRAFGDAHAGRSEVMRGLPGLDGGEGLDLAFRPDVLLADQDWIGSDDWRIRAIHTPGHLGGHLCLDLPDRALCFSGDHVMGWSTSIVSPPDGDMTDYLASLGRLAGLGDRSLLPGHGAAVAGGRERIGELIRHRRQRESEILAALAGGTATAADLARRIYASTPAALLPAATRNVLAHLIDLAQRKLVAAEDPAAPDAGFRRT
jgi:glyoxylase-like metal-dependent hydrolase (beta-lactamase superfamily II)